MQRRLLQIALQTGMNEWDQRLANPGRDERYPTRHQNAEPMLGGMIAPAPQVAIIVPVFNALEYVQRSLKAIVHTYPGVLMIVVDDYSHEITHKWISRFLFQECPGERELSHVLLRNERQQLFTRSVNRGIRWAYQMRHADDPVTIDFVAIVDSDCELHDNWLKALLLGMEDAHVGLVGFADHPDGQEPAWREVCEPDYITGPCLLLRTKMLEEVGVFCETDIRGSADSPGLGQYLGQAHVGSDRALSWRANRSGWKTLECHCRLCHHHGSKSWRNDLVWLANIDLQPLWPPCDQLENPAWIEKTRVIGCAVAHR